MKIEIVQGDKEYRELSERQKASFEAIAQKIEAGESLSPLDRKWAAGAIRAFAKAIPEARPNKKPGNSKRIIPGDVHVLHAINLVLHGKTKTGSITELANQFNVDTASVRKALGLVGTGIAAARRKKSTEYWLAELTQARARTALSRGHYRE